MGLSSEVESCPALFSAGIFLRVTSGHKKTPGEIRRLSVYDK